ncbi:MAG: glycosyltransferase [Gaiellaceae bacterium]
MRSAASAPNRLESEHRLRILHAPSNIAGIPGLLARAQRDLGFEATSVEYFPHEYGFRSDRSLGLERSDRRVKQAAAVGRFALGALRRYDVFHFYFGNTLFPPPHPDLALLRALRKRVVFHFNGCEVRDRAENLMTYEMSGCTECVTLACLSKRPPHPARADAIFVATPDLLEFVPGAKLLPGPIDLGQWTPRSSWRTAFSARDPVRILHAPSAPDIKGTRHLIDAVDRLNAAGYPVELMRLEGVPHSEVARVAARADIAVDQLMMGAYGTVSVELMATGVPVVCRIRDDLWSLYPNDLPIVSAGPESIYEVLERLICEPAGWPALGRRGIEYVRREHEMHAVAARVLGEYGVESRTVDAASAAFSRAR